MALENLSYVFGLIPEATKDLTVNDQPNILQATGHLLRLQYNGAPIGIETTASFNIVGRTARLANVPFRMPAAPSNSQFNEVAVAAVGIGVLCVLRFPSTKTLTAGDVVVFNSLDIRLDGLQPELTAMRVMQCLFGTTPWYVNFPDIVNVQRLLGVLPRGTFGIAPYSEQYTTFSGGQSQGQLIFGPLDFDFTVYNVSVNGGNGARLFFNLGSGVFVGANNRFIVESIKLV